MRELERTRARSSVSTITSWGCWGGAALGLVMDPYVWCLESRRQRSRRVNGVDGVWQERNKETWDVSARG
jgi:hypothetical protein